MAIPHKCPVCLGMGSIQDPAPVGSAINTLTCPACHGTGIVWEVSFVFPQPDPWPPPGTTPWQIPQGPTCNVAAAMRGEG